MDWKAFIASVVGSLAWPSVLITLILVLREQIVSLAERLQELSLPGGAKAIFERQLETARKEAESLPPAPDNISDEDRIIPETEERRFMRLAASSPAVAIVETYKNLEGVVSKIAHAVGMTDDPILVIDELLRRKIIDKAAAELFNTLQKARNVAAHVAPGKITSGEALDYRGHAEKLSGRLHYALGMLQVNPKSGTVSDR